MYFMDLRVGEMKISGLVSDLDITFQVGLSQMAAYTTPAMPGFYPFPDMGTNPKFGCLSVHSRLLSLLLNTSPTPKRVLGG